MIRVISRIILVSIRSLSSSSIDVLLGKEIFEDGSTAQRYHANNSL